MTLADPLPRLDRSRDGASSFFVRVDFVGSCLEVSGPLDRRTAHLFTDATRALLAGSADAWAIDVAGLTDCDVTGLRAIVAAYRLALRHGRRLALVGPPPWLRQALARLRLDHHLLAAGQGTSTVADPIPV